jgi:hypothetical protein
MSTWLRVIICMLSVALGITANMSHASERMNNLPSFFFLSLQIVNSRKTILKLALLR